MDTRQTRQGRHSIRELLDWSAKIKCMRFYPGEGQGMGYEGESFGVLLRLANGRPKVIDELKTILEVQCPDFLIDLRSDDKQSLLHLRVKNGREYQGDMEPADFENAIRLEEKLLRLSTQLGFGIDVLPDAAEKAFNPSDHG